MNSDYYLSVTDAPHFSSSSAMSLIILSLCYSPALLNTFLEVCKSKVVLSSPGTVVQYVCI